MGQARSPDQPDGDLLRSTDVLSGLFTLAGFDMADRTASSPRLRRLRVDHSISLPEVIVRCATGDRMFDVSARPFIPEDMLSFAVPMSKFDRMIDNMNESFLITIVEQDSGEDHRART
jgi:hypothetical protein